MKLEKICQSSFLFVVLLCCISCGTVTPDLVSSKEASFDSSTPSEYEMKNSGVIKKVDGGFIITSHAKKRYNALIEKYGEYYLPRLELNSGIGDYVDSVGNELYLIDNQHLAYFREMNAWKKMGKPPKGLVKRFLD